MQAQMKAELNTNRDFITHPGSKGDALENAWIEWLRNYLPNRYSIDKAIVIDSLGLTSHQIDIVIYDNWFTPFIFNQNGFKYIPAEGVYAVFEVKPDIEGNIDYAGEKIESVRQLTRTTTAMINSGNRSPARPLTKILGGILASTNSYTHSNNDTISKHLSEQVGLRSIDIGCIADYGAFKVSYDSEEDTQENDFQKRIHDYYSKRVYQGVEFSQQDNALIYFFMSLTHYLQQKIGTIAAINFDAYLSKV
ncbi:hypothetical protein KGI96_08545 [Phocoenobacter atlanticus subsp. cyclopteri]|nr:hypothetical protein KGI96_08545 [Pasteurella atlantica]